MGGNQHPEEQPIHTVNIAKPFALGKYSITFDDYDRYADATGAEKPDDYGWGRCNRPVILVSWHEAREYIKWLNKQPEIKKALQGQQYRLPSEAEWEYAARAGTTTAFNTGDKITTADANFNDRTTLYESDSGYSLGSCLEKTVPVGGYPANQYGLYDMHGNVSEWVEDCWEASYQGAPNDGTARTTGHFTHRVARGGSWSIPSCFARCAYRQPLLADWDCGYDGVGFRLARTVP